VKHSFLVTDETAGKRKKGSDAFESGSRARRCSGPGWWKFITSAALRHVNRELVQVRSAPVRGRKGPDLTKDFQFGFQYIDFSGFYL
jgi:hypothetical protein